MRFKYPNNPYGIWKDRREWQIAQWMATKKVSQGDLNELLQTEMVSYISFSINMITDHST